jgi:protein ImuB
VLCLNVLDGLSGTEDLHQLADWGLRFSPLVEPVAPGALLLDLTGSRRLFGGGKSASVRVPSRSGAASHAPLLLRISSSSSLSNDSGPRTADDLDIDFRIACQAVEGLTGQGLMAVAVVADTPAAAYALAMTHGAAGRPQHELSALSRALPRAAQSPHVSLPSQTLPSEEPGWVDSDDPCANRDLGSERRRVGVCADGHHSYKHPRAGAWGSDRASGSDFADRVVIVPEGQASAYLARLPPAALRLEPLVVDRLDAVGVRTIGDLLMLPRSSLPSRFGPQLVRRIAQALGEVFESLTPLRPEPAPDAGQGFDGAVCNAQVIESAAAELLEEVLARVIRNDHAIRRLDCVLYSEYAPPLVLPVWLSRGSRNARHMLDLLRPRLEQALARGAAAAAAALRRERAHLEILPDDDAIAGFVGLRLVAVETSVWRAGQTELFEPCNAGDVEQLGGLVDRLVNRLGAEAIVRAERLDDYQPECAYRYVSVSDRGLDICGSAKAEKSDGAAVHAPLQERPLRLLERPQAIRVTAIVPDGPPTWFYHAGREYAVARAWGPERIETGWWRGPDVRRDYFRVQTAGGEEFWVFRSAVDECWYLHGTFA